MAEAKKGDTVVTVGTRKGLFILHSKDRKRWQKRGPYFEGVEIRHAILDPTEDPALRGGWLTWRTRRRARRSWFVLVFVNEDPVAHLPPEDVRLKVGDTVRILPSVAGG